MIVQFFDSTGKAWSHRIRRHSLQGHFPNFFFFFPYQWHGQYTPLYSSVTADYVTAIIPALMKVAQSPELHWLSWFIFFCLSLNKDHLFTVVSLRSMQKTSSLSDTFHWLINDAMLLDPFFKLLIKYKGKLFVLDRVDRDWNTIVLLVLFTIIT